MNESNPQESYDDLERQVRAALRVDDSSEQLARLGAFWHRRSRAQRRRRTIVVVSSLAATVLLAVTAALQLGSRGVPQDSLTTTATRQLATPVTENHPAAVVSGERVSLPKKPISRKPTTYERVVFAARSPRTTGRSHPAAAVKGILDRMAQAPGTDAEALVQSSGLNRLVIERETLRRLRRSSIGEARSMLPLLEVCGTSRCVPALLRLAERSELRAVCLEIVERIGGTVELARSAGLTTNPQVRATIYRRLLTADETSLAIYLRLLCEPSARHEALAVAVGEIPAPTRAELLRCLDDEDKNVRLAAALVLSHVGDQDVAEELIARVTREEKGIGDREAWIALVNSRSDQAMNFLRFAAGQAHLMGAFRRARNWSLVNLPSS